MLNLLRRCPNLLSKNIIPKRWNCTIAADFNKNGYITNHNIMPISEMAELRKKFNELELSRPNQKFVPQEINPHFDYRWMADLCIHPKIIDVMKKILGANIVLLSSTIFTKYPPNENQKSKNFAGDFVGWHQDLKYWGLVGLHPKEKIKLASMWLAIDEADENNGAMQFITGSHTEGYFDHVQSKMEGNILNENQDMIIPDKWQNKIIQTKLSPGQCTIHDGMLVHGSKATLDRRRMGFTAQYCQTCVEMVPMNYTKSVAFTEDFRKPVLLSGEDNFGRLNYFKTKEQMLDQAHTI